MKENIYLDEILSLRPKDDAAASVIETAITEIIGIRNVCLHEAARKRAQRKVSLLTKSSEELNVLDVEASKFEIVAEQADEILGQLGDRLQNRREAERLAALAERRLNLDTQRADFATRFHALYGPFAEAFTGMMAEYQELETARWQWAKDSGLALGFERPVVTTRGGTYAETPPISPAYFKKVCLPSAGLKADHRFRTPMLHHGEFWITETFEPVPQADLEARWADNEKRAKLARENQISRDASFGRNGSYRDGVPSPERDLSLRIADEAADAMRNS